MEPTLALAASVRDWPDVLHRFLADHGGARVRLTAMGAEDLLSESFDVLLIDDICSFLTPRLIELVRGRGPAVIGVYDPDEFADAKERLLECGVPDVIEAGAHPDEVLKLINKVVSTGTWTSDAEPLPVTGPSRPRLIAVGGPAGGVGSTEVTLAVARRLAGRSPTILVDADDHAPAMAQRLGLPLHPNLRTAIDVVEHRTGPLDQVLHPVSGLRLRALPGLVNPRDWTDVRPHQALDLIQQLEVQRVVVNVGSQIEPVGYGDARFGLSRMVVERADLVVAVGTASPVGVGRLLDWIASARALRGEGPVHVLVNRAPHDPFRRGELLEEITRTYRPASFAFLPEDAQVTAAAWEGRLVTSGRFNKAVDRWVDRFVA